MTSGSKTGANRPKQAQKTRGASDGKRLRLYMVAGALYEAIHKILGKSLHRLIPLPRNGRHLATQKYSKTSSPSSHFRKNQARQFGKAVGVTGLVLTKVDGTAKGGIVIAIAEELKLPVRFLGVGETMEDLVPFDAESFAAALFSRN